VSVKACDDLGADPLICTYHFSVIFGIKLAGEFGGIEEVTKHDGELPSFRVGRRDSNARCDLRGWLFLYSRRWCSLSRRRGDFLSPCSFARPDETPIIFIDHRMCEKQLVLQVVEIVVIEVKASLESTIRHTSLAFQQVKELGEDFIEGHR
jgi:hypothetical protein